MGTLAKRLSISWHSNSLSESIPAGMYWGWLALAVSLPLFSVSLARVNFEIYHVPLPTAIIAML